MKKSLFFLLFSIFVSVNAHSQTEHLKEINRDIWLPFIDAYGTFNSGKYKSLQSEDFIRAAANNKNLPIPKDYFDGIDGWFADMKKEGRKLSISFRFLERFSSEKIASERGIFELKALDSSGKELWKSYGKFHVFMRKLNGVWKIVVDYDSNEKNTIDEKAYLAAFVMDDFEKY